MALNAAARSRLSEEEKGDADERAPRRSERERGRECADRRALLRSERGKGEGARAVCGGAGRATELRARRGRGAGSWAPNGPRPGVSAWYSWASVWGWPKSVKGIKIKEKLFYIFQAVNLNKFYQIDF